MGVDAGIERSGSADAKGDAEPDASGVVVGRSPTRSHPDEPSATAITTVVAEAATTGHDKKLKREVCGASCVWRRT